jgi:hypothetical protein
MSELDLKEWLQYKLETSADVNVATASKWIAEFIELENIEDSTISEAIKFVEWKGLKGL